jgi:hypothetical protein
VVIGGTKFKLYHKVIMMGFNETISSWIEGRSNGGGVFIVEGGKPPSTSKGNSTSFKA